MSFSLKTDPRRRTYIRLIGEIQRVLHAALEEEHEKRGLTRKKIADLLGKNKSVVTRQFAGTANMTLESLADLAFALNRPVKVSLPSRDGHPPGNHYVPAAIDARGSIEPSAAAPLGARSLVISSV